MSLLWFLVELLIVFCLWQSAPHLPILCELVLREDAYRSVPAASSKSCICSVPLAMRSYFNFCGMCHALNTISYAKSASQQQWAFLCYLEVFGLVFEGSLGSHRGLSTILSKILSSFFLVFRIVSGGTPLYLFLVAMFQVVTNCITINVLKEQLLQREHISNVSFHPRKLLLQDFNLYFLKKSTFIL